MTTLDVHAFDDFFHHAHTRLTRTLPKLYRRSLRVLAYIAQEYQRCLMPRVSLAGWHAALTKLGDFLRPFFCSFFYPSRLTQRWVKRRLRFINRMHTERALGMSIALIGLLSLGLSIFFTLSFVPAPLVVPTISNTVASKDRALRHVLQAQNQTPTLNRPRLSMADITRAQRQDRRSKKAHTLKNRPTLTPPIPKKTFTPRPSTDLSGAPARMLEAPVVVPVEVGAARESD